MASLFVDVHPSKAKLTWVRDGKCFLIASTVDAYSLWQMLLRVVADGSTKSSRNSLYDCCSSRFDAAFHVVLATIPSYPAAVWVGTDLEAPVWVRNCQASPTGWPALGCYPDRIWTRGFWAGLEPARSLKIAVPTTLAAIKYLSSDCIATWSVHR